jgi:hypothetical protein
LGATITLDVLSTGILLIGVEVNGSGFLQPSKKVKICKKKKNEIEYLKKRIIK